MALGWAAAVRIVKRLVPNPKGAAHGQLLLPHPRFRLADCQWCCRHFWEMGWNYYIYYYTYVITLNLKPYESELAGLA